MADEVQKVQVAGDQGEEGGEKESPAWFCPTCGVSELTLPGSPDDGLDCLPSQLYERHYILAPKCRATTMRVKLQFEQGET